MNYIGEAFRRVLWRLLSGYRPWLILVGVVAFVLVIRLTCRHNGLEGLEIRDPAGYAQLRERGIVPLDSLCVRVWLWPALAGCLFFIISSTVAEAFAIRRQAGTQDSAGKAGDA